MLRTALLLTTFLLNTSALAESPQGTLVIAGGAISHLSTGIFDEFAHYSGGEQAKIAVVPAATSSINKQFNLAKNAFVNAGVKPENIYLLPLAVKDDKETKSIDESQWRNNGNAKVVAKSVENASGVWFIGGDQTLITKVLLNDDGSDTEVLKQIRKVYARGGTLGGTSAGAAIMSDIMIAGGNSYGALFEGSKNEFASMDEQEFGPVVSFKGFGFFRQGIIDQHFDRKGRLGRLIVTILNSPKHVYGFGVDEGTAMIVSGDRFEVIGEGGVTFVDTRNVTDFDSEVYPVKLNNVRLSFVQPGDSFQISSNQLTSRSHAGKTVSHEYFNIPEQSVSGLVNANRNLDQFIGYDLLDNKATKSVTSWVMGDGQAIKLIFTQDEHSQGFWSTDLTADVYSFENVRLDIKPVKISISNY